MFSRQSQFQTLSKVTHVRHRPVDEERVDRAVWVGIAILRIQKLPIMLSDTLLETVQTEIDWCAADND